jgi:hypothetical protein
MKPEAHLSPLCTATRQSSKSPCQLSKQGYNRGCQKIPKVIQADIVTSIWLGMVESLKDFKLMTSHTLEYCFNIAERHCFPLQSYGAYRPVSIQSHDMTEGVWGVGRKSLRPCPGIAQSPIWIPEQGKQHQFRSLSCYKKHHNGI